MTFHAKQECRPPRDRSSSGFGRSLTPAQGLGRRQLPPSAVNGLIIRNRGRSARRRARQNACYQIETAGRPGPRGFAGISGLSTIRRPSRGPSPLPNGDHRTAFAVSEFGLADRARHPRAGGNETPPPRGRSPKGLETLDLLHGKRNVGSRASQEGPAKYRFPSYRRSAMLSSCYREIAGVSGLKPDWDHVDSADGCAHERRAHIRHALPVCGGRGCRCCCSATRAAAGAGEEAACRPRRVVRSSSD
jgi:hypothetical protein